MPKRRAAPRAKRRAIPKSSYAQAKVHKVMKEYKSGALHSGSKRGPVVHSRKQAIAIALSEARRRKRR